MNTDTILILQQISAIDTAQNVLCCCYGNSPLLSPSRLLFGALGAGLAVGPLGGRGAAAAPEGEPETGTVQARRDPLMDSPTTCGPGLEHKHICKKSNQYD